MESGNQTAILTHPRKFCEQGGRPGFCCQLTGKSPPLLGLSSSICTMEYTKLAKACTQATRAEWS